MCSASSTSKWQAVRGMPDVLPQNCAEKQALQHSFYKKAQLYGFSLIETPLVEEEGVFRHTAQTSDIVMKEMFAVMARGEDKKTSLVLRPEGTAPLMRAVIQHGLSQQLPLKWCYAGPMFRYDRPQKGRLRQFTQVGVENLGSLSAASDVDTLSLAHAWLCGLGLDTHITLEINSLGSPESRALYSSTLTTYLMPYKKELSQESQTRLALNPLRIFDSKNANDQKILENAPLIADALTAQDRLFFESVLEGLQLLEIPFKKNPRLVRGLDYYTHTTFEFKTSTLGAQSTVLAGGRFDGLSNMLGGPSIPGVGWACGLERLLLMKPKLPASIDPFAVMAAESCDTNATLRIAHMLREKGVPLFLITDPASLSKKLRKAHQRGLFYAFIISEKEVNNNELRFKNMKEGSEKLISLDEAAHIPHLFV